MNLNDNYCNANAISVSSFKRRFRKKKMNESIIAKNYNTKQLQLSFLLKNLSRLCVKLHDKII